MCPSQAIGLNDSRQLIDRQTKKCKSLLVHCRELKDTDCLGIFTNGYPVESTAEVTYNTCLLVAGLHAVLLKEMYQEEGRDGRIMKTPCAQEEPNLPVNEPTEGPPEAGPLRGAAPEGAMAVVSPSLTANAQSLRTSDSPVSCN